MSWTVLIATGGSDTVIVLDATDNSSTAGSSKLQKHTPNSPQYDEDHVDVNFDEFTRL